MAQAGNNLTLYSLPSCEQCKFIKHLLDKKGFSYSVNQNTDEMINLGISSVPILSVDGKMLKYEDAINFIMGIK